MTTTSVYANLDKTEFAGKLLSATGAVWLTTAILGQWLFAYYILVFYGGHAIDGDWAAWSKRMIHGFIDGDWAGNAAVFIHILLAFTITFGGPLQLIPAMRKHFPVFHRYNGRMYIATTLIMSVASIYMIWSREAVIGGLSGQLGTTLDGLLIIAFAVLTVKFAMARRFDVHQRWALRLFIVVSGVWFFRVIRGFWILINDGTSPGTNGTLTGPFDMVLNFAGYLLPLFLLEVYFRAKDSGNQTAKLAMSVVTLGLTIGLGLGIYSAAQIFWLPNI